MVNNVMSIIEMQSLNGNSSEYQQKKLHLDQDGLDLLRSVKKKMYMNNYVKCRKLNISLSSASVTEVDAFINADDDDVDVVVAVVQTDSKEHPIHRVLIEQTSKREDVNASTTNHDDDLKTDSHEAPVHGLLFEQTIISDNDVAKIDDEDWKIVKKKNKYWNRGK